jgi:hypothetical protein
MRSRKIRVTTLLAAGASAVAIAAAPVAAAAPGGPACVDQTRSVGTCQSIIRTPHLDVSPEANHQTRHPFYGSFGPFGTIRYHQVHP